MKIFLFNNFILYLPKPQINKNMELTPSQRSALFNIVKNLTETNPNNIRIISSDHPNKAFIYDDKEYTIIVYFNTFNVGVTSNNVTLISLLDKKSNYHIKFDSCDYIIMLKRSEYEDFVTYINNNIFDKDTTDNQDQIIINKILNL